MIDPNDPGDMLPVGGAVLFILLVILEPMQVALLIVGAAVMFLGREFLDREQTDPVEELLEEPRVEPEEALVGGRIAEIIKPADYANADLSQSLAKRLDGEAILLLEDDETTIVDDVLQRAGLASPGRRTVLVDRETASVLHEGAVVGIQSQEIMVPLPGVWEASSDVDLDPELGDESETSEAQQVTFVEDPVDGDLGELFDDLEETGEKTNLPVVR